MITQSKTKQEFEQWYNTTYPPSLGRSRVDVWFTTLPRLPFSMQAGLYQEYFRSVGIEMWVEPDFRFAINKTLYTIYTLLHSSGEKTRHGNYYSNSDAWGKLLNAAANLREEQLVNNIP